MKTNKQRRYKMIYNKAILHIGSSKTGTTSLQETFISQSDALNQEGYFFPANGYYHSVLESAFCDAPAKATVNIYNNHSNDIMIQRFHQQCFDHLLDSMEAESCHTLILSNERLTELADHEVANMASFLFSIAKKVEVYCYLREPEDHFISNQKQYIRSGVATLEAPKLDSMFRASIHLPAYIAAFGQQNIFIKPFDRTTFRQGNVVYDFLDWIGAPISLLDVIIPHTTGESLSHEGLMLANALNQENPLFINRSRNKNRALETWTQKITGRPAQYPKKLVAPYQTLFKEDRNFIEEQFGIIFDCKPNTEKHASPWQEKTINDLATLINQQALKIQHLESELWCHHAIAAEKDKRIDKAKLAYEKSLTLNPENTNSAKGLNRVNKTETKN